MIGSRPTVRHGAANKNAQKTGGLRIERRRESGLCEPHAELLVQVNRHPRIDEPVRDGGRREHTEQGDEARQSKQPAGRFLEADVAPCGARSLGFSQQWEKQAIGDARDPKQRERKPPASNSL